MGCAPRLVGVAGGQRGQHLRCVWKGHMRLILSGCEYAGKSTLALAIAGWMMRQLAAPAVRIHDHWVFPHLADQDPATCYLVGPEGLLPEEPRYGDLGRPDKLVSLTDARAEEIKVLSPWLLEQLQRAMIWRHVHPSSIAEGQEGIQVGFYYSEAVYAPLYYGYGEPGSFADRSRRAREWDEEVLKIAPETVLVLLRASPEVIRERLMAEPRSEGVLKDGDVERVLCRFEDEYESSKLGYKLAIDTSGRTLEQSLAEFIEKVEPFLTEDDRRRMVEARGSPA